MCHNHHIGVLMQKLSKLTVTNRMQFAHCQGEETAASMALETQALMYSSQIWLAVGGLLLPLSAKTLLHQWKERTVSSQISSCSRLLGWDSSELSEIQERDFFFIVHAWLFVSMMVSGQLFVIKTVCKTNWSSCVLFLIGTCFIAGLDQTLLYFK